MIVDKIEPSETGRFYSVLFIVFLIDDPCDSADDRPVFQRQPIFRVAEIECRILVFSQREEHV